MHDNDSTNGEVDFDCGAEADGESGDKYVGNDAVVGEHKSYSADVFIVTVSVEYGPSKQRTVTQVYMPNITALSHWSEIIHTDVIEPHRNASHGANDHHFIC